MERIRVYRPDGEIGPPPRQLAATPEVLGGLRLAALDNGKPNANVLMQRLGERLAERAGVEFVGIRRKGSAATPCEDDLLEELRRDADLVLTGSAD